MPERALRSSRSKAMRPIRLSDVVIVRVERERPLEQRPPPRRSCAVEQHGRRDRAASCRCAARSPASGAALLRFVQAVEILQRQREIVEGLGIVGPERQRLAIGGLGLLRSFEVAQRRAEIVPGVGEVRPQLERATIGGQPRRAFERAQARCRDCCAPGRSPACSAIARS